MSIESDVLIDNSVRDLSGDAINGSEVDANPVLLAQLLDGTLGTSFNAAASPLMNFTNLPYTIDHKVGKIRVYNNSGGSIAAGDALYISGYNSSTSLYEVTKAVVTQANTTTLYTTCFADASISNAAQGNACFIRPLTGQNTSGLTVGRPVWLSSTAGGWLGARSSFADTDFRAQIIGYVATVHASTGRIIQKAEAPTPYSVAFDI